jgi:hypothetical protein
MTLAAAQICTPPGLITLVKKGSTTIEPANNYSENTVINIKVVYPDGHPQAGQIVTSFNGDVTIKEESGTKHYDGKDGATLLPRIVNVKNGQAEVIIKSVSNSDKLSGPDDARISATAPNLQPPKNPLIVDQWVDKNPENKFIDWLEQHANAILACAKGSANAEVKAAASSVSRLSQYASEKCGETNGYKSATSPIKISPLCCTALPCTAPGLHRLNVGNTLSNTVIHEARHAWQNAETGRNIGTDDDSNPKTPSNDDDHDFLLEIVSFPSADKFTEAIAGTGDDNLDKDLVGDPLGYILMEVDAIKFGDAKENLCP